MENKRIFIFVLVGLILGNTSISLCQIAHFLQCPLHYHNPTDTCRIGANYGQVQTYNSGYFSTYLHPGIDILGEPNQKVYSICDGIVKAIVTTDGYPNDPYMWRIAISDGIDTAARIGFVYAHLQKESIPFKVGDTVKAGVCIGKLILWSNSHYTHVHFTEIYNPSSSWTGHWTAVKRRTIAKHGIKDTSAPVFEKVTENEFIAFKQEECFLSPDSLKGKFKLIFKGYDLVNSGFKNSISEVDFDLYSIKRNKIRRVKEKITFRYDAELDVYAGNKRSPSMARILYSLEEPCKSIDDGFKDVFYYYVVTKSITTKTHLEEGDVEFDSSKFAKGEYLIKIKARDYFGNQRFIERRVKFI